MSAEAAAFDPTAWTHGYAETNGVRLHYVTQGEGPLLLLLHGFPEHWYSWRHQITPLAEAGFRVVAPDLRGYNLSDKPRGGYDIKNLTKDVRGLIRSFGEHSATIVGHDWGGVIALQFPIDYPDACDRLIVMNAPLVRSWYWGKRNYPNNTYALLMQVPGLAERRGWSDIEATTRRVFTAASPDNDAFSDEDIAIFAEALAQPKALSSAMKYYRSIYWPDWFLTWPDRNLRITCPTQFIWGREDRAVRLPFMEEAAEIVDDLRTVLIDDAGHWVQQERPTEVTAAMLEFLAPDGVQPAGAASQ